MKRRHLHLKKLLIINYSLLITLSCFSQINNSAQKFLLNDSVINTGHIGISVFDPSTNTYLYSYNATKNFIPASNVKLFTLYAGMKYLGDSLVGVRYEEDSLTLKLLGTGDPTFLHPEFENQPVLKFLLENRKEEIKLFERAPFNINISSFKEFGRGWAWDDYNESFMTERSFFPIYGNIVRFKAENGKIKTFPSYFQKKTFTMSDSNFNKFKIKRLLYSNSFFVKKDSSGFTEQDIPLKVGVYNVVLNAETELLSDTLHKPIQYGHTMFEKELFENRVYSRPIDSLFIPMMHNSDNFFAEQTLLMVSNEKLGYMNDENIIDTLLNTVLKDIPQKPRWVDGCGLSRYNLFTPQSFVYILNKMKVEFGGERMKQILPTGGEGTLKSYYLQDSGRIYAKTGSLSNNTALSGYIITKKGKELIFSILVNNFQGSGTTVRRSIENFIEDIIKGY